MPCGEFDEKVPPTLYHCEVLIQSLSVQCLSTCVPVPLSGHFNVTAAGHVSLTVIIYIFIAYMYKW